MKERKVNTDLQSDLANSLRNGEGRSMIRDEARAPQYNDVVRERLTHSLLK